MIKQFIRLEWKQFFRASYFQKGIAIKILLVFAALYFGGAALMLGVGLFFLSRKIFPDVDPIVTVNNFIIYWFLFEMVFRFFMQQLPVMNVKPLMTIPIKRNTVIHYLLGKTSVSFFNFLAIFLFLPFCVILLVKGYAVVNVLCWFLSIVFLTLSVNYLNFLINKNNTIFYIIAMSLIGLIGLEYYGVFAISKPIGIAFNTLYNQPYLMIIPLLLVIGL
jgi:hypothetical protein